MRLLFASLKYEGLRFPAGLAALLGLLAGPARAEPAAPLPALPLLFDAREHLPLPDLSIYPRVRFLTTTDFPPFGFVDQNGLLAGFHVDLVREICAALALGDRCQIQAVPFEDLEKTLAAGQAEAVIAGVAITPERRRQFVFSRSYLALPARFAVRRAAATPAPGWRVGVVAATVHEAMAKAWFTDMRIEGFETREALLEALKDGRIDAAFADALRLSFWTAGSASAGCCALAPGAYVSERFLGEGLAIMVAPRDAALALAFDHALAELSGNGRLEEIYLRYFPQGLF